MSNIYVTVVRTGKNEVHETVPVNSTPREVFEQADIDSATYSGWSITDEDGNSLSLDTPITATTALVCGAQVNGAV